jgi:hypothetical protein
MNYSWSKIVDVVKVDNLIKKAQRDIRTYSARKNSAEVRNTNSAENISEREAEIQEAQAEFDSQTAKLAGQTPGTAQYNETLFKLKRADVRLFGLQLESNTTGEEALLEKEYGQAKTEALLAEAVEFEAGAQARKAELQGS